MAESSVVLAVKRLGDLLIEEAIFLHGVSNKVAEIQTELKRMQCFLKDADARQDEDEMICNRVAEIREVAFDAEDVIETFAFRAAALRRGSCLRISLKRLACIFFQGRELHRVGTQIDAIKGRISNLTAGLQTYNIRTIGGEELSSGSRNERRRLLRRTYSHVVDEDTVGVEGSVKILVEQLVKPDKKCSVVSIWGMGGLGKTTLAKKVYHHVDVRRHFDCFAWICISQQFNIRGVVLGILIKLTYCSEKERTTFERMSDDEMFKKVYELQEEKRCLVILDDLWKIEDWESLRPAFPLHERRSRASKLVLTTRNQAVALHLDPHGFIYQPKYLTEEESWELLQRKAFPRHDDINGRDITINKNMKELGKEMVKYCGGLPLAVIVLGGLLATKNTFYEWELVHRNIMSYLRNKGNTQQGKGVSDVLALSYQDLPYHLKPCFLYLAHFPEDHEIPTNTLIRMWVAEGIISNTTYEEMGEETLEDVAEGYLDEIIGRCMVQVTARSSNGKVKNCRLHDLMRDLCLSKAKEENFLEIMNFTISSSMVATTTSNKVRRRAIYLNHRVHEFNSTLTRANATYLRSLVIFCCTSQRIYWYWMKLEIKDLTFLRVLDLGGLQLKRKILRAIGNLIHLKFLSIKNTWLLCFPSSIRNLGCIQTLDLRFYTSHQVTCSRIHDVISGKNWLRHLYLPGVIKEKNDKVPWDSCSNLETLKNFDAGKWDVKDLAQLTKLRKLKMTNLKSFKELEVILKPQCPISNSLQSLALVHVFTKMEEVDVQQLSTCQHLSKLSLSGDISNLPGHHHFPPNLSKLTLKYSRLKQDPMPSLEKLLNLTILHLFDDVYLGEEMIFSTNGFHQLKHLILSKISNLKSLRLDKGAMPSLKSLRFEGCNSLKVVPKGLRYVTTLQLLEIRYMPKEFVERLQVLNGEKGEDFYYVQHIPSISFITYDNLRSSSSH